MLRIPGLNHILFGISVFINVYLLHIYRRLPTPETMNEMDAVHQEPEGMVQY